MVRKKWENERFEEYKQREKNIWVEWKKREIKRRNRKYLTDRDVHKKRINERKQERKNIYHSNEEKQKIKKREMKGKEGSMIIEINQREQEYKEEQKKDCSWRII